MTTLLTGATGFVGGAVARELLAAGHRLRVLVRRGSDRRNLEGLDLEPVEGDLRDPASLRAALEGCRFLFHVAADYRLWAPRPEDLYRINVDGTGYLVDAALEAGIERMVYTSSVAVLGLEPDGRPADEDTPSSLADMIGPYKRSKFLAEALVRRAIAERGLPAVIVNPSTPIGPRDRRPTPTGRMILDAACGRMPAYVDTGLNLVHVDDVARGHLLAFEHGRIGERYILGNRDMSLREILTQVAVLAGRRPPRVRLPHWLVMPVARAAEAWARRTGREPLATVDGVRMARKRMYFSADKARRELGFAPRPVEEALREAVEWFFAEAYCRRRGARVPQPKADRRAA